MCEILRHVLCFASYSMPIVDANCETLDKTLRSCEPCPASGSEEEESLSGDGGQRADCRGGGTRVRDINCKCGVELDRNYIILHL